MKVGGGPAWGRRPFSGRRVLPEGKRQESWPREFDRYANCAQDALRFSGQAGATAEKATATAGTKNDVATIAKYWQWMPRGNCGAG